MIENLLRFSGGCVILILDLFEKEGSRLSIAPFSYNKLWKLLIDRNMTKEQLRVAAKMSPTTISAMGKGEVVSGKTIEKICQVLNVTPGDIMEIK